MTDPDDPDRIICEECSDCIDMYSSKWMQEWICIDYGKELSAYWDFCSKCKKNKRAKDCEAYK